MKLTGIRQILAYTLAIIIITILCTVIIQLLLTRAVNSVAPQNQITNDVVINRIEDQFFTVTSTVYSDQETTIKINRGSDWNEFLWGKEILAAGRVRSDIGVNFKNLKKEDIIIDHAAKTITFRGAQTSILDASIYGKLKVTTQGTILSQIFDKDSNEDYKLASEELIESAKRAITNDPDLLQEAKGSAEQSLNYIFQDSGYTVKLNQ